MNKFLVVSAVALMGTLPLSLPAQAAATSPSAPYCSGGDNYDANDTDFGAMLRAHGINASGAEEWNGCIRAFVTDRNGHEAQVFYDPDTLAQVGSANAS